ncbi:MAG: NADH-quinone oxidoreductase subunit J [Dissulfuribacterales bacterium]
MDLYFWVFASMSVLAGLFTIAAKDALPSAMGLLTVFIALASLYLHLHAPLIAIFQVAIYAGAILILVVFVIMLLMTPGERMGVIQANASYRGLGVLLGLCCRMTNCRPKPGESCCAFARQGRFWPCRQTWTRPLSFGKHRMGPRRAPPWWIAPSPKRWL